MPEWGWIILFVTGVPIVAVMTWVVLKRGGSIGIGKNTLTIPSGEALIIHGERSEIHSPLGRALHYVPDNIGLIYNMIYGRYLRIVKSKGVKEAMITDLEDSHFARSLIKNATMLGNGSRSVQKIIESHIARRDFLGKDIDAYLLTHVVPQVVNALQEEVNSEYDTVIHVDENTTRTRIVTQVEFVDALMSREMRDDLIRAISPFLEYAKECMEGSPE